MHPERWRGLDEVLGLKRSRLPIAAFLFGLTGTSLALLMQFWMLGYDWPMIIGGKPHSALPPFIPVTFELTVLFTDGRGGCVPDKMETEWISFEEEPGCWAMSFVVPKGSEYYVLVGGVRGGVDARPVESFAACGFAVVGSGRV